MHYIQLSAADVKKLTSGGNKRIICQFNDQYKIHAAIMRTKEGMYYVMMENYRTGLLWNLFMSCPEIKTGLKKLGFTSPHLN